MCRVIRAPRPMWTLFAFEISSHQGLFTDLARTNRALSPLPPLSKRGESASLMCRCWLYKFPRIERAVSTSVENDKPIVWNEEGGGVGREPEREIDGTSRRTSLYKRGSRERFTKIHNVYQSVNGLCGKRERTGSLAPPPHSRSG